MDEVQLWRMSRKRRDGLPWQAYGIKYPFAEANRRKQMLEKKGWKVSVYKA